MLIFILFIGTDRSIGSNPNQRLAVTEFLLLKNPSYAIPACSFLTEKLPVKASINVQAIDLWAERLILNQDLFRRDGMQLFFDGQNFYSEALTHNFNSDFQINDIYRDFIHDLTCRSNC